MLSYRFSEWYKEEEGEKKTGCAERRFCLDWSKRMNNSRAASRHEHLVCLHKPAGVLQTPHWHRTLPFVFAERAEQDATRMETGFKNMKSVMQKFFLRSANFYIFWKCFIEKKKKNTDQFWHTISVLFCTDLTSEFAGEKNGFIIFVEMYCKTFNS